MSERLEEAAGFVAACSKDHSLWTTPAFPDFFKAVAEAKTHDEALHNAQGTAVVFPAVLPAALLESKTNINGPGLPFWHAVCMHGHPYWQSFPPVFYFNLARLEAQNHDLVAHGGTPTAFILPAPL
jgi:hypothetical protein